MFPEDIDSLKYAELRSIAKGIGIKANLKADKLRCAIKEYYGASNNEKNESVVSSPQSSKDEATTDLFKSSLEDETFKNDSQIDQSSGRRYSQTSKRRRTQSPTKQESSRKRNKRSGTYEKEIKPLDEPPHELISDDESGVQEVPDDLVSEDGSPGVKEVVDSLKEDMTSEQMKEALMDAINKRAKEKVERNAPLPEGGESMIPRFTAIGEIRTYSQKKPITPGQPDWSRIHQRQFDRMQGIDAYLEAKKQRSESLTASMKKMRMLTQQMRNAVNSVKSYRTPPSLLKGKSRIVKPVQTGKQTTSHSNKSLFKSPANKPFVPTVTSTSKANFNFAAINKKTAKSPAPIKSTKSPGIAKLSKSPRTTTVNDKIKTPQGKDKCNVAKKTPAPSTKQTLKSPALVKTTKTPKVTPVPRKVLTAKRTTGAKTTPTQSRSATMSTPAQRLKGDAPIRKSPRLSGISSPVDDMDSSPTITFNPNASINRSSQKENRKSTNVSAKKSTVTPFRFSSALNRSNLNSTQNTSLQKSRFDLTASLSKPITWKPHTGKLQPFKMSNVYSTRPMDIKQATGQAKAAASKNNRRALAQRARLDKRSEAQMKRRGIVG